jgi:selenocysteine lyase/cysteine desulfurase
MVRVGAVHYNTLQEVERLKSALINIAKEKPYGNDTAS